MFAQEYLFVPHVLLPLDLVAKSKGACVESGSIGESANNNYNSVVDCHLNWRSDRHRLVCFNYSSYIEMRSTTVCEHLYVVRLF